MPQIHPVYHLLPEERTVQQALQHADCLAEELASRVVPFAEDWDLVILAQEVRRLKQELNDKNNRVLA